MNISDRTAVKSALEAWSFTEFQKIVVGKVDVRHCDCEYIGIAP